MAALHAPQRYKWVPHPPEVSALLQRLREALATTPPAEVYARFLAENDALIRDRELGNGHRIVSERTAIHSELVPHPAAAEHRRRGYTKPFAVVALGGTGRGEVTPRSDLDYAFLFDDSLEGNRFLLDLQRQTIGTDAFADQYGFGFEPLPFNFDDVQRLARPPEFVPRPSSDLQSGRARRAVPRADSIDVRSVRTFPACTGVLGGPLGEGSRGNGGAVGSIRYQE